MPPTACIACLEPTCICRHDSGHLELLFKQLTEHPAVARLLRQHGIAAKKRSAEQQPTEQPAQRLRVEELPRSYDNIPIYIKRRTLASFDVWWQWLLKYFGVALDVDSPILEAIWVKVTEAGTPLIAWQLITKLFEEIDPAHAGTLWTRRPEEGQTLFVAVYQRPDKGQIWWPRLRCDFAKRQFHITVREYAKLDAVSPTGTFITTRASFRNWFEACLYFFITTRSMLLPEQEEEEALSTGLPNDWEIFLQVVYDQIVLASLLEYKRQQGATGLLHPVAYFPEDYERRWKHPFTPASLQQHGLPVVTFADFSTGFGDD